MIDPKILEMADKMQGIVSEQMIVAKNSLLSLPEGATKEALSVLLKKASSGKVSPQDAQREIQKIIKNAN